MHRYPCNAWHHATALNTWSVLSGFSLVNGGVLSGFSLVNRKVKSMQWSPQPNILSRPRYSHWRKNNYHTKPRLR
jgi:hypothetical protein